MLPATSPLTPEIVTDMPPASVVTSIGSLKVSTIGVFTGTLVAPWAGVAVTVGWTVSAVALAPVVKVVAKLLSVLPARSQMPCSFSVYAELTASAAEGVKVSVARSLLSESVPGMTLPPLFVTCTVCALTHRSATGASNCSVSLPLTAMPVAPSAMLCICTTGAVVSFAEPVVKLQEVLNGWPARSSGETL